MYNKVIEEMIKERLRLNGTSLEINKSDDDKGRMAEEVWIVDTAEEDVVGCILDLISTQKFREIFLAQIESEKNLF